MAKGKQTPALFEIINRAQREGQDPHLQVPGWWRNSSETAQADRNLAPPSSAEERREEEALDRANYDRVAEAVELEAAQTALENGVAEANGEEEFGPYAMESETGFVEEASDAHAGGLQRLWAPLASIFRSGSGRVDFSLSYGGATIAAGLMLFSMAAAFTYGFVRGEASGHRKATAELQARAEDSIELARRMQPDASVLQVPEEGMYGDLDVAAVSSAVPESEAGPVDTAASKTNPPATSKQGGIRRVGWNYLVVQNFRGEDSLLEARKAQRFVLSKMDPVDGQPPVTIERRKDGSHMLLSTIGYPQGDEARKQALHAFREEILKVGKLYAKRGSGYDFRDAYPMRLSR